MKRIVVTDKIKGWAKAYAAKVKKDLKTEDALNHLKSQLSGNEADYVQEIVDTLTDILDLSPWDYSNFHDSFYAQYDKGKGEHPVDLGRECALFDKQGKKKQQQLYMHIVDALGYTEVQQEIFPEYVKKMGIRSCVYCNAQYAVSSKKGKTERGKYYRTTFTLDHWKPKSKFPYLAVAFYNLYPCCAPCNQAKSWCERDWMMYCNDATEANPFVFEVESQSLADYLATWDAEKLKIQFKPKVTGHYPKYDEDFHVSKLYSNFKSEVEDVIWRSRIYNDNMIEAMQQSGVYTIKPEDVNRFIIGNYDREEDILKRPLAKLIQDVAKQLKII